MLKLQVIPNMRKNYQYSFLKRNIVLIGLFMVKLRLIKAVKI